MSTFSPSHLTEGTRRALIQATGAVTRWGHEKMEPVHLLLGLLESDHEEVLSAFQEEALDVHGVKSEIENSLSPGVTVYPLPRVEGEIPREGIKGWSIAWSVQTVTVLEVASEEAERAGRVAVEPRDLLVALKRTEDKAVQKALAGC